MHDLDVQIRDYLDATSEPLDVDDIWYVPVGDAPVRPIARRRAHRRSRREWLIAATAAAVVLVALGILPFLLRSGPIEPAATTIPTPTTAPTPTSTVVPMTVPAPKVEEATPTTVLPGLTKVPADRQGPPFVPVDIDTLHWTKVDIERFEGTDTGGLPVVERDIDGYVISGAGRLLFSQDAQTWSTDPISPELAEYAAFRSEGQWAVAGQSLLNMNDLLRSDGEKWQKIDLPESEGASPEMPIVSGISTLSNGGDDYGFWVSADDGPFVFVEPPWVWPDDMLDPSAQATIVAAPDGGFVALVTVNDVHPNERSLPDGSRDNQTLTMAELWTSPDGLAWQNSGLPSIVPDDAVSRRPVVLNLHSDPNHIILSRSLDGTDAGTQYLTSTNGLDWENEGATYPTGTGRPGTYTECRASTGNFGYFCGRWGYAGESGFSAWLSTDHESWQQLDPPEIDFESYDVWGATSGAVGNIIFAGYGDIWIGQFR